jgi:isocitrate lyase
MQKETKNLTEFWESERWHQIKRPYTKEDVSKFSHSFMIDYTLANHKAESFWNLLSQEDQVYGMSTCKAEEGVDQVESGIDFICLDDTNQPNTKVNSVSEQINHVNKLFQKGYGSTPIIVKTKSMGFKPMTELLQSGVAGVWCNDQATFNQEHKTGVLMSTKNMMSKISQIRLAADVCRVPSVIIASTNSNLSTLIECDANDEQDQKFVTSKKFTIEGYQHLDPNLQTEIAIERGLAYATYADVVCLEANEPDLKQAEKFANAIHSKYPEKPLAYNCSSNFNWTKRLTPVELQEFQNELTDLGYSIQCISPREDTYYTMRKLSESFCDDGFAGYANLEEIFSKVDTNDAYREMLKTIQTEQSTLV